MYLSISTLGGGRGLSRGPAALGGVGSGPFGAAGRMSRARSVLVVFSEALQLRRKRVFGNRASFNMAG